MEGILDGVDTASAEKPKTKKRPKPKAKKKVSRPKTKTKRAKSKKPAAKKKAGKKSKAKRTKSNGVVRSERLDMRLSKAEKFKILAKAKKARRTVTSLIIEAIEKIR